MGITHFIHLIPSYHVALCGEGRWVCCNLDIHISLSNNTLELPNSCTQPWINVVCYSQYLVKHWSHHSLALSHQWMSSVVHNIWSNTRVTTVLHLAINEWRQLFIIFGQTLVLPQSGTQPSMNVVCCSQYLVKHWSYHSLALGHQWMASVVHNTWSKYLHNKIFKQAAHEDQWASFS